VKWVYGHSPGLLDDLEVIAKRRISAMFTNLLDGHDHPDRHAENSGRGRRTEPPRPVSIAIRTAIAEVSIENEPTTVVSFDDLAAKCARSLSLVALSISSPMGP